MQLLLPGPEVVRRGVLDQRKEELGEEEVAEVVGAELHVKAVLRLPVGANLKLNKWRGKTL